MSEESKEFNLSEAANELIASETPETATQVSGSAGQSQDSKETVTEKELSPQDILKQVSEEKPSTEPLDPASIEQLNALGFVRNGNPFKVESAAQIKELIQKGFDYTEKTMAHANEAKLKQEEYAKRDSEYQQREQSFVQKEQQLEKTVFENNIMENLLLKWQKSDPDLVKYIAQEYQNSVREFEQQKPLIAKYEGQFKELNDRIGQFEKGKQQEELGSIKQTWEKGLNDAQAQYAAPLAKLGVTPNWDKVKEVWAADSTNKMTVEGALYAIHGKDIAAANKSYQNLLASKNKVAASKLGRGGVSGGQKAGVTVIPARGAGDYESMLRQFSQQL